MLLEPAPANDSTFVELPPPIAKAAVLLPLVDPKYDLALLKSPCSVQAVPFHTSVFPVDGGSDPPKATASVLLAPDPPSPNRVEFKFATSVQEVPFHDSVSFF